MTHDDEDRAELRRVAGALRAYLEHEQARGRRFLRARAIPAAPAPAPPLPRAAAPTPDEPAAAATPRGADGLRAIREDLGECTRCKLCAGRSKIVFGAGSPDAALMFVGEGPGADEDAQGVPFVGKAGQLLTRMIEAMGLARDEVYIANVIKCRPPGNRNPEADEVAACEPFLRRQIDAVRPRILVGLGNFAVQTLLRTDARISSLRGRFHRYQGVPLMPTYHPAFLLRSPEMKKPVWEDLKLVMAEMDRLGIPRRAAPPRS